MSMRSRCLLVFLCCVGQVLSQQSEARRTCQIGRIESENAPLLDGILTDACWSDAPAIGELVMVEPWLGRKPVERTIVKLLHDRRNLYISVWCEQSPETVRNSQRVRDARLDPDDLSLIHI